MANITKLELKLSTQFIQFTVLPYVSIAQEDGQSIIWITPVVLTRRNFAVYILQNSFAINTTSYTRLQNFWFYPFGGGMLFLLRKHYPIFRDMEGKLPAI